MGRVFVNLHIQGRKESIFTDLVWTIAPHPIV